LLRLSEITRLSLNWFFAVFVFQINCAPVCESCEQLHINTRCPMDPTAPNAWNPGDLNAMFERIVTDPAYAAYQPKVLSRPSYAPGDNNETADYKIGLWMVMFDSAVSDEEADRLRELGEIQGYERSSDVGKEQPDGTFTAHVNEKRTSTNSVR
jgi:prolyl 4-hydroxylase